MFFVGSAHLQSKQIFKTGEGTKDSVQLLSGLSAVSKLDNSYRRLKQPGMSYSCERWAGRF